MSRIEGWVLKELQAAASIQISSQIADLEEKEAVVPCKIIQMFTFILSIKQNAMAARRQNSYFRDHIKST